MSTSTQEIRRAGIVARSPVFYGWIVWAVATVGLMATSPGQTYSVSLFIDRYIADFNLDRTTISGMYSLGTFIASLSLTYVGRLIDRLGNRKMSVIIVIGLVLTLVGMSFVAGPLALLPGFIALRGFGQGALGMVNTTAIAQWFQRRRGRMVSLAVVLLAVFQGFYVPWLQSVLEVTPWQQVWLMLAALVALTFLPLTLIFMRDRPEDFGLQPDGDAPPPEMTAEEATAYAESNWTLGEAMWTPIFWVFIIGRFLPPAWVTGMVFHQLSLFGSLGHPPEVAAQTYSLYAGMTAVISLGAGFLVDNFKPNRVLIIQLGALIIAMFMSTFMIESWHLLIYAIGVGISMGVGGVFDGAVWTNLFGRENQGSIRGFVVTIQVAGTATGPFLFGLSFDLLGGYAPVLWVGIAYGVVAVLLNLFVARPPRRRKPKPAAPAQP